MSSAKIAKCLKPLSVTTNVVGLQTDDAGHVARVVGLQTDPVVVTEAHFSELNLSVNNQIHLSRT